MYLHVTIFEELAFSAYFCLVVWKVKVKDDKSTNTYYKTMF